MAPFVPEEPLSEGSLLIFIDYGYNVADYRGGICLNYTQQETYFRWMAVKLTCENMEGKGFSYFPHMPINK